MHQVQLQDAQLRLAELIDEATYGEDVMIIREDGINSGVRKVSSKCPKILMNYQRSSKHGNT